MASESLTFKIENVLDEILGAFGLQRADAVEQVEEFSESDDDY